MLRLSNKREREGREREANSPPWPSSSASGQERQSTRAECAKQVGMKKNKNERNELKKKYLSNNNNNNNNIIIIIIIIMKDSMVR